MIGAHHSVSRNPGREVAVVAAALLLPVPLLAATAAHLPLPAAVERGLASLSPGGAFGQVVERDAPAREAAPPGSDSTPSGQPAGDVEQAPEPSGGSSSRGDGREAPADRPQRGAAEPTGTPPPGSEPGDAPGGDGPDAPPPESPPAEPDTPPATAAPADAPDELAVGLGAGGISTEVEAGSDGVEVTVTAGGLVPPTTTLPLPLP